MSSIKVLVKVDESILSETLRIILVRKGYSVLVATSREHAESLLQDQTDIAFLICNAGSGGMDLARFARNRIPSIRVIITTGGLMEGIAAEAAAIPAVLFCTGDLEFWRKLKAAFAEPTKPSLIGE